MACLYLHNQTPDELTLTTSICCLFKLHFTEETVDLSGIRTRIIGV